MDWLNGYSSDLNDAWNESCEDFFSVINKYGDRIATFKYKWMAQKFIELNQNHEYTLITE